VAAKNNRRQQSTYRLGKRLLPMMFAVLCITAASAQTQTPTAPATTPTQNAAPAVPAPTPPLSGTTGNNNSRYTDRIPPEQLITLEAGADKFQARHIPDLSGKPRGAAIVLHDSGQHPNWPFTAAALIDDLPLHGWDTLNIELQAPADSSLPTAPTNPPSTAANPAPPTPAAAPAQPAANNQPAAAVAPLGIEPQAQARIVAAMKYFSDQQQRNVVLIGFGSGAIRAAELMRQMATSSSDKSTAPITALIMVAPRNTLPGIEMDLPKILPATELPTLDVTLDSEPQARADAELRRRAVLHQRTRIYRQMELPPVNNTSDAQHSGFVKRIRAWLQRDEENSMGK